MPYIRAVLFDLWGTLLMDTPERSDRRYRLRLDRLEQALAGMGGAYPRDDIDEAFRRFLREHGEMHNRELDVSARGRLEMFTRALDPSLEQRLDDAAWRALEDAFFRVAFDEPPEVVPGAAETVAAVRSRGLRTGLVSNVGITPGFVLRDLLAAGGVLPHLDALAFSDEVLAAKPSPRIFRYALESLEVPPSLAAFVGDMPVLDVLGAQRAGIWSLQVGNAEVDGVRPHARIARISDLLPALADLGLVPLP